MANLTIKIYPNIADFNFIPSNFHFVSSYTNLLAKSKSNMKLKQSRSKPPVNNPIIEDDPIWRLDHPKGIKNLPIEVHNAYFQDMIGCVFKIHNPWCDKRKKYLKQAEVSVEHGLFLFLGAHIKPPGKSPNYYFDMNFLSMARKKKLTIECIYSQTIEEIRNCQMHYEAPSDYYLNEVPTEFFFRTKASKKWATKTDIQVW